MSARKRVVSIAPHARFLDTLADGVLDGTLVPDWDISAPFGLSDLTIVLPTRRARTQLADAFARRLGGTALLPDIRTFGGDPGEEEPFLPPLDEALPPPPVGPVRRRLLLAEFVAAWIGNQADLPFSPPGVSGFASPPNPAEILALADSLGELIDDCHVAGISSRALRAIPPEDLARNWQATLSFLEIALEQWPRVLEENGEIDAAARRNILLERQARAAPRIYGDRPVIAAGSTGSIPATARLLAAIAELPRGVLVLPGLDTTMPDMVHERLRDPRQAPHSHPQYGLGRLLGHLGLRPGLVEELASAPNIRTAIVRHALAPAEETAHWSAARNALSATEVSEAVEGLATLYATTDEEQARAIAIAAREALARQRTVGIVTPDRNLARRIAAELRRFAITVDDSAGTPLFHSRAGRLARQVLACVANRHAAVDLMALLRNRHACLGLGRAEVSAVADLVELGLLRGQRPALGLEGLGKALAANLSGENRYVPLRLDDGQAARIEKLFTALEHALAPCAAVLEKPAVYARDLAEALSVSMARVLAGGGDAALEGLEAFMRWAAEVADARASGPALSPRGLDAALERLMAGASVHAPQSARDDIHIWGQIEARLQNPDLLVLAGLNEGVWPGIADPGPWLSRGMRIAAGLEPPERLQGLAAHDFEMALGNAEVIIALSGRRGTSPAMPSRLLQRLEAFLGDQASTEIAARGQRWLDMARDLDFADTPQSAIRPAPCPPAHIRPRSLSVTEVETLVRSPYDLYAKHVLKLRKLDPLGEDIGARERGNLIHEVFRRFVVEGCDPNDPAAAEILERHAAEVFSVLEATPERRTLWLSRFRAIAAAFLDFERARDDRVAARHAELGAEWTFPVEGEDFTLRGRADRVDLLKDGTLEILDFKTGGVPEPREMRDYIAPQMLLEALLARSTGFPPLGPAEVSALTYLKIGAGPDPLDEKPFVTREGLDLREAADEMHHRLSRHVGAYLLRGDQPMTARIFPNPKQRFRGDYDHLARTDEWTTDSGEEGA